MPNAVILTADQLDQITRHIESCLPEEACGLIGGKGGVGRLVIPVENELHSPVRFRMAPLAQLKAMDQIEALGWDLLAIFHSHPQGPAGPSPTDVAEFFYPGTVVIIASPSDLENAHNELRDSLAWGKWRIRSFIIENNQFHSVKLSMVV